MEAVQITYNLKLNAKTTEVFDFKLDGTTFDLIAKEVANPPDWTKLDFQQCSHCTLKIEEHPYCPLALQAYNIIERFHNTKSIDMVELEVITEQRRVLQNTSIQTAIASMLGLLFPICGCPKTTHLKPLARFHVPLASDEETVFHVTGMYLLAQYFLMQTNKQGKIEFDGLIHIYNDLHILNTAVARRMRGATASDSVKNAVALLDMYSTLIPMLLEDQLVEMRGFFNAYLPEGGVPAATSNYFAQLKELKLELIPTDDEIEAAEAAAAAEVEATRTGRAVFGAAPDIPVAAKPKPAAPATPEVTPAPAAEEKVFAFGLAPIDEEKPAEPELSALEFESVVIAPVVVAEPEAVVVVERTFSLTMEMTAEETAALRAAAEAIAAKEAAEAAEAAALEAAAARMAEKAAAAKAAAEAAKDAK